MIEYFFTGIKLLSTLFEASLGFLNGLNPFAALFLSVGLALPILYLMNLVVI